MKSKTWILRYGVATILLMHSIPAILDGSINSFGSQFLDNSGFAPVGVRLAWVIKLSHIACALALIFNRYTNAACVITIFVLIMGIVLVHFKNGWYVVGGGRNGIEFNFLLIVVLLYLVQFDQPIFSKKKGKK